MMMMIYGTHIAYLPLLLARRTALLYSTSIVSISVSLVVSSTVRHCIVIS